MSTISEQLETELKRIVENANYSSTNEDLDAIVQGLDLRPDDSVLAVAGSGDQVFAILEYAGRVRAIDSSPSQLQLVRLKVEALGIRMQELFFYGKEDLLKEISRKREYFSAEGRLERIRDNLDNLVVLESQNIFALQIDERFSKIYLSNALDWSRSCEEKPENLSAAIKLLSPGGLLYISNSFTSMPYDEKTYLDLCDLPGLEREFELTQKARELEKKNTEYSWSPIVYRKVSEAIK